MISLSLERVGQGDVVDMLFTREDSKQTARTFLQWLQSKGGRCTKAEMSAFSHELAAGKRGLDDAVLLEHYRHLEQ